MTANLYVGAADPAAVVRLVRERDVDVLSLQELTPQALRRLDAAGLRRTMPHRSLAVGGPFGTNGSAVLSRRPLTAIPDADGALPAQPAAVVALLGGPRVRVQAVHPPPPISGDAVRRWRAALAELPAAGDPEVADVLAGDFNATLDHRELRAVLGRGYRDAAAALGAGLRPTWPAGRRLGRLTIDHVLADERATPLGFTVHTLPGTDHRAVVAELALPAAGPPRRRG